MNNEQAVALISVRNPWALLIIKRLKTIENRSKSLGNKFLNRWIALQVSFSLFFPRPSFTQKNEGFQNIQNHRN